MIAVVVVRSCAISKTVVGERRGDGRRIAANVAKLLELLRQPKT
jgi:hypothetical protein